MTEAKGGVAATGLGDSELQLAAPYADVELHKRQEVAESVYASQSAKSRREKIHPGYKPLRKHIPCPNRLQWVRDDCPKCKGKKGRTSCPSCHGRGVVGEDRQYAPHWPADDTGEKNKPKVLDDRPFVPAPLFQPMRSNGPTGPKALARLTSTDLGRDSLRQTTEKVKAAAKAKAAAKSKPQTNELEDDDDGVRTMDDMTGGNWKDDKLSRSASQGSKSHGRSPSQSKKEQARKKKAGLEARPAWDTEHHIKHSRMNHEVQVLCREYFDVPKRKDGEGVPKTREHYAMNDRACGWNDEPDKLGEMRRTFLDHVGPWNVNGPKCQQLPSYWRNIKLWSHHEKQDVHLTNLRKEDLDESDRADPVLTSLALTHPSNSTQVWKGYQTFKDNHPDKLWRDTSTKQPGMGRSKTEAPGLPSNPSSPLNSTMGRSKSMGSPSNPSSPLNSTMGKSKSMGSFKESGGFGDTDQAEHNRPISRSLSENQSRIEKLFGSGSPSSTTGKSKRETWNDRWSVMVSKDNQDMTAAHRQYFTSAQYLSGAESGHPGTWLGGAHQRWRNVAKNVNTSTGGALGRTSNGRFSILT